MDRVQITPAFASQRECVDTRHGNSGDYAGYHRGTGQYPSNVLSIEQARMEERCRIGRELHDSTSQLLVALQLRIAFLKPVLAGDHTSPVLEDVEQTLRDLQREIRIVAALNQVPDFEAPQFARVLRELGRRFASMSGLAVSVAADARFSHEDLPATWASYRIAQEALANVHRHAAAQSVSITLANADGMLRLKIRDDGIGISRARKNADRSCGLGLENIRARARALGGTVTIRRAHPGTELSLKIPLFETKHTALPIPHRPFDHQHRAA